MDTATASNLFLFFIIWILLSWAIGNWNVNKGHGFWTGHFVSFFLSPAIGVIIVAATPKGQSAIDKKLFETGTMKRCPKCVEVIKVEAVKCRYCGSDLTLPSDGMMAVK
jgi:hypothetical protein